MPTLPSSTSSPSDPRAEGERTAALLAALQAWTPAPCADCGVPLCHHARVLNAAMGFQDAPRCAPCLAGALERPVAGFLQQAHAHILGRACFRTGWEWASRREASPDPTWPTCLFPAGPNPTPARGLTPNPSEPPPEAQAHWDAGDMTCGDLVLELRLRVRALEPGQVLHVTATDGSAPEDLPAWCRVTGHPLRRGAHPDYWIQRKEA